MGICAQELVRWVIRPTLQRLGVTSRTAEQLLLATAAQESGLGAHLRREGQRGMGLYQIQSLTHRHVWDDYLVHHPELASTVRGLASQHDFLNQPHAELTTNLSYATAIAWLVYARNAEFSLPEEASAEELAALWKRFYHPRHDASAEAFCACYQTLIALPEAAA